MKQYDAWRENEIKLVGAQTQYKAETMLDKQASDPFVQLTNQETGETQSFRRCVADRLVKRPQYQKARKVFLVPYIPALHDKKVG